MGRRFDDRLIPPGINDARVRYLWGAFDTALADIELSPGTLCMRTSAEMTTEMLPLAVWELSLEEFMPEEGLPEHVVRRLIDRAYELHAWKGTDEGVKLGLKLLTGLQPDIVHWWQKTPRGQHDTHTITAWVGEAVYGDGIILSEKVRRAALKIIEATKRWSQDTDFRLGAGWSSRAGLASAAAALAVDRRTITAGRNTDHRDVLAAADAAAAMQVAHPIIEAGRNTDHHDVLAAADACAAMQIVTMQMEAAA